ncbi:hypothetical protein SEA_CLIFTON_44 [Mycobacterium phage Clifton]|nr:hypothetical protein SEA_PIPPY_47 [Mycobacterium phage Pippy]AXC35641.1 hypothetical protein SEA_CLIFTON_44 [Mycobacterium phage Clifton]QKO03045.1 hypothetical protein SEA_LASTJEDI_43 [Mycobacterium phage LastJedi]
MTFFSGRRGSARHGKGVGMARRGMARLGTTWQAWLGMARLGRAWLGAARHGRHDMAGAARRG